MQEKIVTNVAFVDMTTAFGGAIISLSQLANNLDRTRFSPMLIYEMNSDIVENLFSTDIPRIRIRHGIGYTEWQRFTQRVKFLRNKYLQKIVVYALFLVRSIFTILYSLRVAYVCQKNSIKILHVNNGSNILEGCLIAKLLGIKLVVHQRGETHQSLITRFFYRRVNRFVAISNFIREVIISNGGAAEKIDVVYNPVELDQDGDISLRGKYGLCKNDICIGVFGRIIHWKGQEIFVKAAIELLSRHPNLKAFLVGDASDSDRGYYRNVGLLAKQSDVSDRIVFTGYVSNVADYYRMMDIVVHTSILPEPFGRVIIEAMIQGKPVVASDEGGPKEIINDGEDGLLIEPGNPNILAASIEKLIQNTYLRYQIGQAAQKKALASYSSKAHAFNIAEIYEHLL